MIYYFLVFLAVVGLALQFSVTKFYQTKYGASIISSVRYTALVGLFGALIFLAVAGFSPEFTGFSLLCAFLIALLCTVYSLLGFKIMAIGSVSIYTMFLMLGGMLLPYLYGVFMLGERLSAARVVGMVLMIVALILPCFGEKKSEKRLPPMFWILCSIIFVLNGCVSIVSKLHQVSGDSFATVPSEKFVILTNAFSFILSMLVLLVMSLGKKREPNAGKSSPTFKSVLPLLGIALLGSAFSGASYFLQLVGASNLPASVLYPMVTGGSIILTAVAARILFREKPTKPALAGLILAFCATFLFLF